MQDRKVVRNLLADVLKNEECAHFLLANQSASKDFRIECSCGGVSTLSTVYFNSEDYEEVFAACDEETQAVTSCFHHYVGGSEAIVLLTGVCKSCRQVLKATAYFLND